MVVGMACGTKFYPVAIITTFVGCSLVYYMTYTNFGQKGFTQDVLEMYFPTDKDYASVLSPLFVKHLKYYSLLSVDSVDDKTNRLSFLITLKPSKKPSKIKSLIKGKKIARAEDVEPLTPKSTLIKELKEIKEISNIKIIEGSSSLEI